MHVSVKNLQTVNNKVKEIVNKKQLKTVPQIIAVSKTFQLSQIIPLLDSGHLHFGENKVQEANDKWKDVKKKYQNIQLHMLGKLQSNKAKIAVKIFDYIHSLDNAKLASKIQQFEKELNKKVKIFIQVNIGEENQKSGILIKDLENFYYYCTKELSLNIIGLMCIPPADLDPINYFTMLKKNSEILNLKDLSMGMSDDFEKAIICGSTYLRLGSIIFGERSI